MLFRFFINLFDSDPEMVAHKGELRSVTMNRWTHVKGYNSNKHVCRYTIESYLKQSEHHLFTYIDQLLTQYHRYSSFEQQPATSVVFSFIKNGHPISTSAKERRLLIKLNCSKCKSVSCVFWTNIVEWPVSVYQFQKLRFTFKNQQHLSAALIQ